MLIEHTPTIRPTAESVNLWRDGLELDFDTTYDADGTWSNDWNTERYSPRTWVVDREGVITQFGAIESQVLAAVDEALAATP